MRPSRAAGAALFVLLVLLTPVAALSGGPHSGRAFTLRVTTPEPGVPRSTTLTPKRVRVPSGDGRADLVIDVKPDSSSPELWDRDHEVGMVTISRAGSAGALQTLRIRSRADASLFAANCALLDVNFDGHPDLVTLAEQGASWGRWSVRLYRPSLGRFVRTPLTRDLARLRAASFTFDAATRTITTRQLAAGLDRTYAVSGRSLRPADAVRLTPSAE